MQVKTNGDEIVCTREHPFYVPVRGWTAACDLRAGDILVRSNGEYVVVEMVEHELLESPITVYNFEVEDFHTYHVGSASVLVHNKCSNGSVGKRNTPDQDALIQIAKEHKRGVSKEEANILVEWAKELGVNTHEPLKHFNRGGIWSYALHIVIRNLHVRVFE